MGLCGPPGDVTTGRVDGGADDVEVSDMTAEEVAETEMQDGGGKFVTARRPRRRSAAES